MAGVQQVAKAYEDKTVEAVALALADAVVDGENCGAAVSACAASGENEACCDLLVDNTANTFSKDAIAEVSARPSPPAAARVHAALACSCTTSRRARRRPRGAVHVRRRWRSVGDGDGGGDRRGVG